MTDSPDDLEKLAEQSDRGLLAEFWDFLKSNKKWWLAPLLIVLLLLGLFIGLTSSAVAPFIYPLF